MSLLRQLCRWWTVAALLPLCCRALPAAQNGSATPLFRVQGTVVDGKTGKPLARALVATGDRKMATMTGNEGKFSLEFMPQDAAANAASPLHSAVMGISAVKPGYLRRGAETTLRLDDTAPDQTLVLKLMPAASISGHVTTPDTDAPRHVRVRLLQLLPGLAGGAWASADEEQTNSRGEFRFDDLNPGEYTVVTATWRDGEETTPGDTTVTTAFPPTYNGDRSRFESAQILHLHYGDVVPVELHLHPEPFYPVKVRVGQGSAGAGVEALFVGADAFSSFALEYNASRGALEGALPAGTYDVMLQSQGKEPQSYAPLALHVAKEPLTTGPVTLAPAGQIPVHVHTNFTAAPAQMPVPMAYLNFVPLASGAPAPRDVGEGSKMDYILGNAPPGRYRVYAQVPYGYLASITSGGVDLKREPLAVGPGGAAPIELVLRDDMATVKGSVTHGDQPLPKHVWVAASAETEDGRIAPTIAEVQPDGTYVLSNVAPGSYRIFASGSAPSTALMYGAAQDATERLSRVVAVTSVGPGQQVQADAPLLDDADLEEP